MTVVRINEFEAAENQTDALHDFLKSLIPYISASQGCLSCEVLKNSDQKGRFVVLEKWASIEAHQSSVAGFPKEDMQAAMSLFGAPPKGHYYES